MPGGVRGVKGRSQGKSGRPKQVPRAKWVSLSQAADQIRQAVKRNPKERQVALLHLVTDYTLAEVFFELKQDAAASVDGVT